MKTYLLYYPSGEIKGEVISPDEGTIKIQPGVREGALCFIESLPGLEHDLFYIDVEMEAVKPRQDYSISELPLPCVVTIEGVVYHINEQPTFEFDAPGSYTISVDAGAKFLKKEFIVESSTSLTT